MENTIATETKLVTSEYYINYYGTIIDIYNTKKVLALFVGGGGYSGDMGQYYGTDNYDLYMTESESFGRKLIKIGTGHSYYNGYEHDCKFTINNESPIEIKGMTIDNLFNKIFKR